MHITLHKKNATQCYYDSLKIKDNGIRILSITSTFWKNSLIHAVTTNYYVLMKCI